jgi:hypothetical protein
MNRTAFILSVALTAFVLLLTGGIVTAVRQAQAKAVVTPAPTVETVAEPTVDPAIQQVFAEREQAYQDVIAEANARLDQLQQANQSLQAQLNAIQSAPTAAAPATVAISVTPEEAAQIAARYLNRTDLYSVESAQYNGMPAYMVTFSSGDIVYVGTDGQVLFVQPAKGQIALGGNSGGHEHEGEHEHESEHEGDD